MDLSGKWVGEYSQLSGLDQPAPLSFDLFEINITYKKWRGHGYW